MATETFTGDGSWTVPSYVSQITVTAEGEGTGGNGGRVVGTLSVTSGETLYIRRTAGGPGGESTTGFDRPEAYGQDGGDAIDIRRGGSAEGNIVALAAGGGGDADGSGDNYATSGGADGGNPGEDAADAARDSSGANGGHGGEAGQLSGTSGADDRAYYGDGISVAVAGGGGGAGFNGGTGGGAEAHDDAEGAYDYVDGAAAGGGGGDNYVGGLNTVSANETGSNSGGPQLTIEYTIPAPTNLTVDAHTETTVDLSWDDSTDAVEYDLYRSTSSPATGGSRVATITDDGSAEFTYTDTGLDGATTYHYQVVAVDADGGESDPSTEASATTDIAAPTAFQVDSVSGDEITVTWTDNATTEDGYRVHVSRDGGSTWTQDSGDLPPDTEQYTTTALLDGEEYTLKAEVFGPDASAESGTDTAVTELPDAGQPSLGNGVEDEIAVSWTDVIDYGEYRIQVREVGETTWDNDAIGFVETTVDEATTSTIITDREDGEEYEVRMRTETEHVTGAWTSPVSIVTKFPGATNLTANLTEVGGTFTWTDNADNEDGFRFERRRLFEAGWGEWQLLEDLPANTTEVTDDTALPDTEYEYRVTAYTEHTSAATSMTVTTNSAGFAKQRIPASGYYVEVQSPADTWITVEVAGDVRKLPQVNALPKIEIPVPKNEKWEDFVDQPIRAWLNGEQLPIDELEAVEQRPDRTVLRGVGGTDLRKRVTLDVVEEDAHVVAEDLIDQETPYTSNVDEPASTAEEDVIQFEAASQSELEPHVNIQDTDPFFFNADGKLELAQTAFTTEGEDADRATDRFNYQEMQGLSDGIALEIDSDGFYAEWDFTLDYTIPESEFGVHIRHGDVDINEAPALSFKVILEDGTEQEIDYLQQGVGLITTWQDHAQDPLDGTGWTSGDVPPGTHTVRVEATSPPEGSSGYLADVVAPRDNRWPHTMDDDVDADDQLSGPEHYVPVPLRFNAATTAKSFSGGRLEVVMNDTSEGQSVAVSIDGGATWEEVLNATSVDADFAEKSATLDSRVMVSGYGTQSTTPTDGANPQTLSEATLYGDVVDIPVLDNKGYDDRLVNILRDIADYGNFVFEVAYDGTDTTVEWTQPGQRPATQRLEEIVDYDVNTDIGDQVEKAIVFGSARPIEGETFTAQHGSEVPLDHSPIVEASERVHDGSGKTFERGSDYVMRNQAGTIETLSTGSMTDATDYQIDYSYKISNSYTAEGVTDPQVRRFDLQSIPTERGCGQAALYLVQRLKDPVIEAQLVIPTLPPSLSVINAIDPELLGVDKRMQIRDIEQTPVQAVIALESRESGEDVLDDLETRLASVARRV